MKTTYEDTQQNGLQQIISDNQDVILVGEWPSADCVPLVIDKPVSITVEK